MIEIFRREGGKDHLVKTFNSFEEFFSTYVGERDLKAFGYTPSDLTLRRYLFDDGIENRFYDLGYPRHCYIAYLNGDIVPPDVLVGKFRKWLEDRPRPRWMRHDRRDRGERRHVYGKYRGIRTTQERRWAHAWDDEEFAPVRGFNRTRRNMRNLPDAWDDIGQHVEKSWKRQSKRRHQWRP